MSEFLQSRYRLVEVLGQGSMGVVWRAQDTVLDRLVALKELRPPPGLDAAEARDRFLVEARAAARLSHPNIVGVHDVFTDGERVLLAMELVEGPTLDEFLAAWGPQPAPVVRAIMAQVAQALAVAHAAGVVHRDLKPGNVFWTAEGRAVVCDFGLARIGPGRGTVTGTVMGTPGYMAPEQVRGVEAGPAADVFAWGAVAYELATGRPPFGDPDTSDPSALAYRIVHEDPPFLDLPEDPLLAEVIARSLAKEVARRPADGRELRSALTAMGAVPTSAVEPAPAPWAEAPAPAPDKSGQRRGRLSDGAIWGSVIGLVTLSLLLVVAVSATTRADRSTVAPLTSGSGGVTTVASTAPTTMTVESTAPPTTVNEAVQPQAGSCPAPTPPSAAPAPGRPRYVLTVDARLDENVVRGTLSVRFTPDLNTDRLVFRLWPNGPGPARGGALLETGTVTLDRVAVPAQLDGPTTLVVRPARPIRAGQAVDVALPWTLRLPGAIEDRVSRNGDAVRLGSFFPLLSWEPGVGWATDPPVDGLAEASSSPTADFDVSISVPAGIDVLASGREDRPGHWSAPAVRDFAISLGRFRTISSVAHAPDPVEVTVGVHQGLDDTPEDYLALAVGALEQLAQRYGPYTSPSLTLAVTPNLDQVSIEYPGHIMLGAATQGIVKHEVAHMWFYSLVGNNQASDPWMDEALATYADFRLSDRLDALRSRPVAPEIDQRVGDPMTKWGDLSLYADGVYIRGAQAILALGDASLVDCALKRYAALFAYRIATPADFVSAVRAVLPQAPSVLATFGVRG